MERHSYTAQMFVYVSTHGSVSRVHALEQLLRVIIKTIQAGGGGGAAVAAADVEFKMEC